MNRRAMLETIATAGAGALLAPVLAAAAEPALRRSGPVFTQDLPSVSLHGWTMTAVEVSYAPGQSSAAHKHPGFVFAYVIEGDLRIKLDGGTEATYHAGQMFYEQPGSVHRISANASTTKPCRFLAMIFAEHGKPIVEPV